jgi:prolyl oligopeptidase
MQSTRPGPGRSPSSVNVGVFATLATACAFTFLACAKAGTAPIPVVAPGSPSGSATSLPAGGVSAGAAAHDPVVEQLHGVSVADPFRWLEDGDSPAVKAWQAAENERTRRALDAIPGRETLRDQTRALFRAGGESSAPRFARPKHGRELYFHMKRGGDEDLAALYVREGSDRGKGTDRVLIDPAKLAADGPTAIDWWYPASDGALVAYGYSANGSELSTLHVRDVKSGADLPDAIPYTRFASVAWAPDDRGFYYTRLPEPGTVPAGEEQLHLKIFFHRLGAEWKKDRLVFERPAKDDRPGVEISPGGRWLVADVEMGTLQNEIFVRDRSKGDGAPWVPIITGVVANSTAIPREERLYILTNDGAPNRHLYAVEYDHPDRKLWREVIPEKKDVLDGVTISRGEIVATYLHDASTRLERFTLGGKSLGPITLPSIGSATTSAPWDGDEVFVEFESFVVPPEVLRFDPRANKLEACDSGGTLPGASDVETTLTFATSKDGTKIPLFLVSKKGLARDGTTPTLLWGYGGFELNQTPTYRPYALLTAGHGGVFASAVLRGGGELGSGWHKAGMLGNKQNVFDDYAACAEELTAEKITSADKLAAIGRSNGGLLVAAAITQRPELFRAAVAIVPLTDMIRYPRFRIGRWWVTEYGDPDKDEDFKWLYAYSPYHHVKDGTHYPATLLSTGESDNRVDPMHSRKMAARLEEAQTDASRPILLRVDTAAGHGQGKPASKLIEQMTDELSFAFQQLGIPL